MVAGLFFYCNRNCSDLSFEHNQINTYIAGPEVLPRLCKSVTSEQTWIPRALRINYCGGQERWTSDITAGKHHGCRICTKSGAHWPQMGQIRDFFRPDFSTFCRWAKSRNAQFLILGQSDAFFGDNWAKTYWNLFWKVLDLSYLGTLWLWPILWTNPPSLVLSRLLNSSPATQTATNQ